MMIARWQIEARFGHKQTVMNSLKKWAEDILPQIGMSPGKTRMVAGSIGALESTIEFEWQIEGLADLDAAWEKLGAIDAHKQWSKELEPYIVSGTPHWKIFRVM